MDSEQTKPQPIPDAKPDPAMDMMYGAALREAELREQGSTKARISLDFFVGEKFNSRREALRVQGHEVGHIELPGTAPPTDEPSSSQVKWGQGTALRISRERPDGLYSDQKMAAAGDDGLE